MSPPDDRPSLFGRAFDGPMKGHAPGMPIHYDLHAWLFQHNPWSCSPLMTYVVMPWLTRLFRSWLYPRRLQNAS